MVIHFCIFHISDLHFFFHALTELKMILPNNNLENYPPFYCPITQKKYSSYSCDTFTYHEVYDCVTQISDLYVHLHCSNMISKLVYEPKKYGKFVIPIFKAQNLKSVSSNMYTIMTNFHFT